MAEQVRSKPCDWFWGSHGCNLPLDHGGDVHVCGPSDPEDPEGSSIYSIYEGPEPEDGWTWGNVCYLWKRGNPHEFQQVRRG